MKRTLLILILLSVSPIGRAQQIPYCAADEPGFRFDYNRIWDYNYYEHSRWGIGARLIITPKLSFFDHITTDAYVGYGMRDKQWKGGLLVAARRRDDACGGVAMVGWVHDYFAVGSRRIANPNADGSRLLGSFMAMRMMWQDRWLAGYRLKVGCTSWMAHAVLGQRAALFDASGLLYLYHGDTVPMKGFGMLTVAADFGQGLQAQVELIQPFESGAMAVRALASYGHPFTLGWSAWDLYAQAGYTPRHASHLDLFDLGGIYGAPLYIGRTMLTARANEFSANTFFFTSARVGTKEPIYQLNSRVIVIGSNPMPFVGLNMAWGHLWGQDANGQRQSEGLRLQAPQRGIAEAVMGAERILWIGAADIGVVLAYRIDPRSALYRVVAPSDRWALMVTLSLVR